jgi:hypothetical protein
MTPKTRSTACAILAALLMLYGLTGCALVSPAGAESRRLYQPSLLRLAPSQQIQTQDGLYLPQVAEVWHSDARYRALERAYLDALSALQTHQARPTTP